MKNKIHEPSLHSLPAFSLTLRVGSHARWLSAFSLMLMFWCSSLLPSSTHPTEAAAGSADSVSGTTAVDIQDGNEGTPLNGATVATGAWDVMVLNPSFEPPGSGSIYYGFSGVPPGDSDYTDYFLFDPTTSWKKGCYFGTPPRWNNSCHIMLVNPTAGWVDPLPGGAFAPDGNQVGSVIQPYATVEAAIQQDLDETIAPYTTYTLTVWVAPGHNYGITYPVTSSVQLLAILVADAAPCCNTGSKALLAEDRRTGDGTSGTPVSGQWGRVHGRLPLRWARRPDDRTAPQHPAHGHDLDAL